MKRTACFVLACVLGLTLAASAQTQTANMRDIGSQDALWTGITAGTASSASAVLSNSPNPVTFATVIEYTLDTTGFVRLNIYDSKWTLIEALVDEYQEAGRHSVIWNTADRESGAFVCMLNCGDSLYARKIIVLK